MSHSPWQLEEVPCDYCGGRQAEVLLRGREAGLMLHLGTLPGADLPPQVYDVVTMWQALEHVPSPKATLEAVRRLLRPGEERGGQGAGGCRPAALGG